MLFSRIYKEIKRRSYEDFVIIKNACVACANPNLSEKIKRTQDINSLFALLAVNKAYCNWLNIRFLEVIVTASGNSKLEGIIHKYKTVIYSKTLSEVLGHISYHKARTKFYSELLAKLDGKDPDDITVEQLKKMCEPYLLAKFVMMITVIRVG